MKIWLRALWRDEDGQGTVEYMLILSVIVFGATQLGKRLIGALDKSIMRIGGELERDLKTGRVTIGIWKN